MHERIPITKMTGAGNDFVVLDRAAADQVGEKLPAWVRSVCRRGVAVGADGVLVIRQVSPGKVAVEFRNPDGSVAFCGNGTRCAARFAALAGLTGSSSVLSTAVGEVPAVVRPDGLVRLTLPPVVDHGLRTIDVAGEEVTGRFVVAGVPHFVVPVPDLADAPLQRWGPAIRSHPGFGPAGTNLDLISTDDAGLVRIRTWERGVEGETLACGTGAVAAGAVVAAGRRGGEVTIRPWSGSTLSVILEGEPGKSDAVILTGDARVVFRGELDPEALDVPGSDRTV